MRRRLNPPNFPHFLERSSKTYRTARPLGRIYDRVRIIKFDPIYDMAFDARILSRFKLSVDELTKAREVKAKYDIAMRCLMGRHENPVTEFEIWSTFVLSKPRVGNDYKLQEELGRDVAALKDRFRSVCGEAVTGVERKDFIVFSYSLIDLEKLDRFVAAMYTVTHEEVQEALRARAMPVVDDNGSKIAEGRGSSFSLPLVSFPWLFHQELNRIATGGRPPVRVLKSASDESPKGNAVAAVDTISPPAGHLGDANSPVVEEASIASKNESWTDENEDYVRTSSGQVVHRGETLDLFGEAADEAPSAGGEESDNDAEFEEMEMEMENEEAEEDALDALTRKMVAVSEC